MKVWVVEDNIPYSSGGVEGVFSSKEKAEVAVKELVQRMDLSFSIEFNIVEMGVDE